MVQTYFATFRVYLHQLQLPWSKPLRANLLRLGAAFLKRPSLPIRRLARTLAGPKVEHRHVDKRFRRFLGSKQLDQKALDAALACHLRFLLARLGAVPYVPVVIDWVFVEGRAILWAQIPYRGRGLPLLATVHPWKKSERATEEELLAFEQALLRRLRAGWPHGASPLLIMADRGFARSPLLAWLLEGEWLFLIRARQGTYVYNGVGKEAQELYDRLQVGVGEVGLFPNVFYHQRKRLPVHMVTTCVFDQKAGKPAYWWLVTNLPEPELRRAPKLYGERMSVEGVHRDSKRGHFVSGYALSHLARMNQDRLERLLCLLSLIYCFLVLVAETDRPTRAWLCQKHWGLALATFGLELLHRAGSKARRLAQQACASVELIPHWAQSGDS